MTTFTHRNPEMELEKGRTALVLVDIQNDFLTEGGKYHVLIAELMKKNKVNEKLETLLQTSKTNDIPVFMSPHYFFPHDHHGHHGHTHLGAMEDLALNGGVVARQSALSFEGVQGSGRTFQTASESTWRTTTRLSHRATSPMHPPTISYCCCVGAVSKR